MIIGERIRQLREAKGLSQGDIMKRTGLKDCYTSRVENGHTVPSIETLQKYAVALEVPMYKFFLDGETRPETPNLPAANASARWGQARKEHTELKPFAKLLARMDDHQRQVLLKVALQMARRASRVPSVRLRSRPGFKRG